ncbi:helix-turn-helix domain-containing protein [Streptomyces lasiicapitis]|uniref:helix-turn-helix domain-containing protein n=1 Tax=Streptomyces lasiicapitis TaxID=1923961 RepID=UPI0036CA245A
MNAPFFTVRECAYILHCSVDTVRRAIADGLLPHSQRKKGGTITVSRSDLDAYHEATRVGPRPVRRITRSRAAA